MSLYDDDKKNRGALSLADLTNPDHAGIGGALRQSSLGLIASAMTAPAPGSPEFIKAVFRKGRAIAGIDPDRWCYDDEGNLICFDDHGQCSEFGWEIDHYPLPAALGGSDDLSNARPLHWRRNRSRGGLLGALLER